MRYQKKTTATIPAAKHLQKLSPMRSFQYLALLFFTFLAFDLLFIYLEVNTLRWVSKSMLLPLLGIMYLTMVPRVQRSNYFIGALCLSWLGDLLLQIKGVFIPGLLAFLLAHLGFIFYFALLEPKEKGIVQRKLLLILPIIIYISTFLYFVFPYLGELKWPVAIYAITIGVMMGMAINTIGKLPAKTTRLFVIGALLFAISDSILAVHLFVLPIKILGIAVMLTYGLAQFYLVSGAIRAYKDVRA
jgi:uncharacterized membrane protein YhhN